MKRFTPHFLSSLAKIHTAYETQAFGAGNCFAEGISKFLSSHRCNAICHYLNLPPTSKPMKQSSEGSKWHIVIASFLILIRCFISPSRSLHPRIRWHRYCSSSASCPSSRWICVPAPSPTARCKWWQQRDTCRTRGRRPHSVVVSPHLHFLRLLPRNSFCSPATVPTILHLQIHP